MKEHHLILVPTRSCLSESVKAVTKAFVPQ